MACDGDRQHNFNSERIFNLFSSCRGERNIIFIKHYIDAYGELCKPFRLFGRLFNFVVSDVEAKIAILRDFCNGEHSEKYLTVQSMLLFEVFTDLIDTGKRPSGTYTFLRLHRAMEFMAAVILTLRDRGNDADFSSHVSKAYHTTISKYHTWVVRHAVHMALCKLPTRQELLQKMGVDDSESGAQAMTKLVSELNAVSEVIDKLYAKYHLLDMPRKK
ncbi:hypothetical protein BsWGS_26919 [Bradybaena similaris]